MKARGETRLVPLKANEMEALAIHHDDPEEVDGAVTPAKLLVMSKEDEDKLAHLAARARAANKRGVELILEIKQILAEAYDLYHRIGRDSTFGNWVAENFPDLSQRTVERYMKIHKVFGGANADTLSRFDVTALHILSEERVSDTSRQMAVLIAEGGGRITAAAARHFASNPWENGASDRTSHRKEPRTPKAIRIPIEGGEVVIKPLNDQLSVATALEQAAMRWAQADSG